MKKHYKDHIKIANAAKNKAHRIIARALFRKFKDSSGPVIIAVGGPGGTGKTTFASKLAEELSCAGILTLDDYKTSRAFRAERNIFGPHPEANEIDLLRAHLTELKKGAAIPKPVYCRTAGKALEHETFDPARFIIAEGEIATYRQFHDLVDFSIFIDSHWKTQLNTRILRDIDERGYTPKKAIAAFLYSNLHEFSEYGAESKHWSDIHIHCDENYRLVIDAVCSKNARFLVEEVSSVLEDVLSPATGAGQEEEAKLE